MNKNINTIKKDKGRHKIEDKKIVLINRNIN